MARCSAFPFFIDRVEAAVAPEGFPASPDPDSVADWALGPVLHRARALIQAAGGSPPQRVIVDWTLRGKAAGQARSRVGGDARIRLNPQLFDYPARNFHELRDTVLHEMAHVCVAATYRRTGPHGPEWRWFARALGARARATHRLGLKRCRGRREYQYRAGDRVFWLGPVRHRRLQSGKVRYRMQASGRSHELTAAAYTGRCRKIEGD